MARRLAFLFRKDRDFVRHRINIAKKPSPLNTVEKVKRLSNSPGLTRWWWCSSQGRVP